MERSTGHDDGTDSPDPGQGPDGSGGDRVDHGLTHVALPVTDLDRSLDFYRSFAGMEVVHRRTGHEGDEVAWISDRTRPFVVVLIECDDPHRLGGWSHLGVGLASRAAVDDAAAQARAEGRPTEGPHDSGDPVGYWVMVADPDGHHLELSYGQEVGLTVDGSPG